MAVAQVEIRRLQQLEASVIKQARKAELDAYTTKVTFELAETAQRERREAQDMPVSALISRSSEASRLCNWRREVARPRDEQVWRETRSRSRVKKGNKL